MGDAWLGRILDVDACHEILLLAEKHGVHPVGEGGEFETLVLDGPNFTSRLHVVDAERVWSGSSGTLHIREAVLVACGDGVQCV